MDRPAIPRSSRNAVTPLWPLLASTVANTRKWSATSARLIHSFVAVEPVARRRRGGRSWPGSPASVPTPGSVSPNVASFSPFAWGTSQRWRCSSVAPLEEGQRVEPDVDALDDPERGVGPLQLLAQDGEADVVHARRRRSAPGSAHRGTRARPACRASRADSRRRGPSRGCGAGSRPRRRPARLSATSLFSSVRLKSTMAWMLARGDRGATGPVPADTLGRMDDASPAPHLTPVLGRYFQREWSHGEGHRLFDTDGKRLPRLRQRHRRHARSAMPIRG